MARRLHISYLRSPANRFPALPETLLGTNSVTQALAENGVPDYTRHSTELTACVASPVQAAHLKVPDGAPLLRAVAINVDQFGAPVEFGRTWFAGDRVTLTVTDQNVT